MNDYKMNHHTLESMSQAEWYNQWTFKKFERYVKGDILEVGCGIGNFTRTLARYGNVWAFDNDSYCVKETKKLRLPHVNVGLGDIEKNKYFFASKKFDVVVCMNVLEHIENDNVSLQNIYKLLKPNGYCILLVPIHVWLFGTIDRSIHHFRRYSLEELYEMITKINLNILWKRKLNLLGAIGWYISGKIIRTDSIKINQLKLFNTMAPIFLPLEDLVEPIIGTSVLVICKK